jgi:hypothetical protein
VIPVTDRDEILRLLTAYADGELGDDECRRVERLLAEDAALAGELESIRDLSKLTQNIRLSEPEQEVWNMYWANVYNRLERGVGWIMLSAGAILVAAWGSWQFLSEFMLDPEVPLILRIGTSAAVLGAIVLIVSALRERLFIRKKERYEEIER